MAAGDDDEALAQAWAKGDRQAGEVLFERYFPRLTRFFRDKITYPAQIHEDLLSQVFVALLEQPHGYRRDGTFRAYVFAIARNLLFKAYRQQGRRAAREAIGESSIAELQPASRSRQPSPSSWLARRERDACILAAIRELPCDLQIALELHYWEAMSAEEIGQVLDLPLGTAKTRLRRAKMLLAAQLEPWSAPLAR